MAFFLIVPSVMTVSAVLIRALTRRLGLQIFYPTLAAVAVLSFMIDFAVTWLTPIGGKPFLLRLAALILLSSLLLTFANRFLLKKQQEEEKLFTEEVRAAYEAEIRREAQVKLEKVALGTAEFEEPPPRYNEPVKPVESVEKPAEPVEPEDVAEQLLETELDEETIDRLLKTEPVDNPALPENFPLDEVFEPLPEIKPAEADKPVELLEKTKPEDNFPLDEVFEPLSEIKPVEADKPVQSARRAELFPLQEVFKPLSMFRPDKLEELTAESEPEDKIETLDDILDRAYNERSKGHAWQAMELYKTALDRYRNDDYAPFVAIDLGNIYKEEALYSKAIKIYEEALKLPAVKRNSDIRHEFARTLEYLRVLRDVLLKYHAMSTPFGKLSKEILQEADTEFRKVNFRL